MTIERSRNLMGVAAGHEAGERRASPIASGAKPLTAEQRKATREAHERRTAIERMRSDPVAFVEQVMGAEVPPWQKEVLTAGIKPARPAASPRQKELHEKALADIARRVTQAPVVFPAEQHQQRDLVDWDKFANHVRIGVDRARPGSEHTAVVVMANQRSLAKTTQKYLRELFGHY